MSYQEKDFQSDFTRWLRTESHKYNLNYTFVYELKIAKAKRLPFSRIEPHQITSLLKAKHECIRHKIADDSRGFKPFDGFQTCYSPAYIIILFYVPRSSKTPIFIDIDDFILFSETQDSKGKQKKSITEEEAKAIGKTYGAI